MKDKQENQSGRAMFIIAWLLFFLLLFLFFYYYDSEDKGSYEIHQGVVTIKPDKAGHYYIDGKINDHPVKFLIDTGASLVAIPEKMAREFMISGRYQINLNTAGGSVSGSLTRLKQLSFAEFNLTDVKAVIVPSLSDDTALLGMNVLSKFNLSQKDDQLIIQSRNPV